MTSLLWLLYVHLYICDSKLKKTTLKQFSAEIKMIGDSDTTDNETFLTHNFLKSLSRHEEIILVLYLDTHNAHQSYSVVSKVRAL